MPSRPGRDLRMSEDTRICVGALAGAFGVKGEVRLKSFTATPEDIAATRRSPPRMARTAST